MLPDTLRVSPSATWHKDNKHKFEIGCNPNPKVIDQSILNKSKFIITTLQVARAGPETSRDQQSQNTVNNLMNTNGKIDISFQRMENGLQNVDFEERDNPMLSPAPRAARDRRQGPPSPDNSMDFPGHVDDQPPGTQPHEGGGQATGSHTGQSGEMH